MGPAKNSGRTLILASRELTASSGLYPSQFLLASVELYDERPIAAGTHVDIRRGTLRGRDVCVKTIRVYRTSIYDTILKVFGFILLPRAVMPTLLARQ